MSDELLLFSFLLLVVAVSVGVVMLAVSQLVNTQRSAQVARKMRRLTRSNQPQVTVLLYVSNQATNFETSLKSIFKSRYYAYDVVVVCDTSQPRLHTKIQNYLKTISKVPVAVLKRRKTGSAVEALRGGYRKSQRGQIVMVLKAGETVDPACIKRAVASQRTKQSWKIDIPEAHQAKDISNLVGVLEKTAWRRSAQVQVYTSRALLKGNVKPFYAPLKYLPAAAHIIAFAVLITLSIILESFVVLWYGWLLVTGYLLATIWLSSNNSLRIKAALSFSSPSAFFLLPTTSFIQAILKLYTSKRRYM